MTRVLVFGVASFLYLIGWPTCAQEPYQQIPRFLQVPGPLQVGNGTSWIDAPLDANGLINYYDKANELVGQHSTNYEDNAVPVI